MGEILVAGLLQHVRGDRRACIPPGYDGHRLNTAQEMTIWNYHRAIDEYLFGA